MRVACYLHDILIMGAAVEEHMETLEQVLQHLQAYGIWSKKTKCVFICDAVEYLGHSIDAKGLHTL